MSAPSESRMMEVCNGAAELLAANIDPTEAIPESVFATNDTLRNLQTAAISYKVRVYPVSYFEAQRYARKRVENAYKLAIATEKAYASPAATLVNGRVPEAWVAEAVAWVAQYVYDLLNTRGVQDRALALLGVLRPETCETTLVYDEEKLDELKVFYSVVEVEYRETVTG